MDTSGLTEGPLQGDWLEAPLEKGCAVLSVALLREEVEGATVSPHGERPVEVVPSAISFDCFSNASLGSYSEYVTPKGRLREVLEGLCLLDVSTKSTPVLNGAPMTLTWTRG